MGFGFELRQLTDQSTNNAQGVSIWVRLVAQKLIEGIVNGNTISQLKSIFNSIPTKLDDLYRRITLDRKPEYSLEIYIMIQLGWWSLRPLHLSHLTSIMDAVTGSKLPTSSDTSMRRRLMSHCGGLLELKISTLGRERETIADNGSAHPRCHHCRHWRA